MDFVVSIAYSRRISPPVDPLIGFLAIITLFNGFHPLQSLSGNEMILCVGVIFYFIPITPILYG